MFFNSFFRTLTEQPVTVELKNDLCVRGTLVSVDQYLNVRLGTDVSVVGSDAAADGASADGRGASAATSTTPATTGNGDRFAFLLSLRETCYIRGSCVRYIHLPAAHVDTELLQDASRRAALEQKRAVTAAGAAGASA